MFHLCKANPLNLAVAGVSPVVSGGGSSVRFYIQVSTRKATAEGKEEVVAAEVEYNW